MPNELRIAHITDLHISQDGSRIREVDVRSNFLKTLDDAQSLRPDIVVLGGDLAAVDGEPNAYFWIKAELEKRNLDYILLAGNHDRVDVMVDCFGLKQPVSRSFLADSLTVNGQAIITLDSSVAEISNTQLQWLREIDARLPQPFLLFMHHPPVECGCTFMDRKYPLKNRIHVLRAFRNLGRLGPIFCGHYHTEKVVMTGGQTIFITPSTMLQIDQVHPDYKVAGTAPGWRFISWDGQTIKSAVRYVGLN